MPFLMELLQKIWLLLGFVGGSTFPKPLSEKEEKKYIELFEKGDEKARNILIEHNLRLVAHIAKKYATDKEMLDDLISIGTIGLIKGINTFDSQKTSKLTTYIARCIENEVLMTLRSYKKKSPEISLEECIGTDKEGNNMTFSDILAAENEDIFGQMVQKADIKRLYKAISEVLTEDEKNILIWRFGLNNEKRKTQKQISKILGISRSYVSRIEKRAIKKLSDKMEE